MYDFGVNFSVHKINTGNEWMVTGYLSFLLQWLQWNILLWDTSIQGTRPFIRGHEIRPRPAKCFICYLYLLPHSTERDTFFESRNLGLTSIQRTQLIAVKKWLTTRIVNIKFKCSLVAMVTAFKTRIKISLKLMYTQHPRDKLVMIFYTVNPW